MLEKYSKQKKTHHEPTLQQPSYQRVRPCALLPPPRLELSCPSRATLTCAKPLGSHSRQGHLSRNSPLFCIVFSSLLAAYKHALISLVLKNPSRNSMSPSSYHSFSWSSLHKNSKAYTPCLLFLTFHFLLTLLQAGLCPHSSTKASLVKAPKGLPCG